jgi:hypothetical protein
LFSSLFYELKEIEMKINTLKVVEDLPNTWKKKNARADEIILLVNTMRLDLEVSRKLNLDLIKEKDRLVKIIEDLAKDFDRIFKGDKE